ncbi:MAG TPA: hypothetical protein VGE53_00460 [Candidatus Paceibacterota bacterium]
MHTLARIQPIVLVGMEGAVLSQLSATIRSFSSARWEPRFVEHGNPVPHDAIVLVSCSRDTPIKGNFACTLRSEAGAREQDLAQRGVEIDPGLAHHPRLVLVKRARSDSGVYSGKPLARFTDSLKGALKVPRRTSNGQWRAARNAARHHRDRGHFVGSCGYSPGTAL